MGLFELGGFLVRKRGFSKQDILVVMFVWLLISVFYFDNCWFSLSLNLKSVLESRL